MASARVSQSVSDAVGQGRRLFCLAPENITLQYPVWQHGMGLKSSEFVFNTILEKSVMSPQSSQSLQKGARAPAFKSRKLI